MIQSMTGYGKKELTYGHQHITFDLQVCNSRFLEIMLRVPEILLPYEEEFKRLLGEHLARGRIRATLTWNGIAEANRPVVNRPVLQRYYQNLKEIAEELQLPLEIKLTDLLSLPDIFSVENPQLLDESLLEAIRNLIIQVAQEVTAMRQREGEYLARDIQNHLNLIEQKAQTIAEIATTNRNTIFQRYQEYLRELCSELHFDENRLLLEAALMIKKLDITEECERLRSHLRQFTHFLTSTEPVGKKLNFLIQEMNREITTMGTKAESAPISHLVVDLKDELEKIREQIQNIL